MRNVSIFVFLWCLFLSTSGSAQDVVFGDISIEELQYEKDPVFPDADAIITYNDINFNFGRELQVHKRVKILSKTGLDQSDWLIPYGAAKGIKAATYTLENGQINRTIVTPVNIFKEELSEDETVIKIAFPNVEVGSVIELRYTVPFIGLYGIYTQEFLPIKKIRILVNNPNYLSLDVKENPYVEIPLRRIDKDFSFLFVGEDIPPLRKEGFVSNIDNHRGQLLIELYGKLKKDSWRILTVGLNRAEWFGGQLNRKSRFLKNEIERFEGMGLDSLALLKAVDNYFKDRYSWDKYYSRGSEDIRKVYQERKGSSGDINLLMTFLLRELGFDARPMLVASRSRGWVLYPHIHSFNSLICAVWLNGQVYVLDGTRKNGGFNRIAQPYANDRGFVPIGSNGYILRPVLIDIISKKTTIVKINVDLDHGMLTGKFRQQMADYHAWEFRNQLIDENEDFYSKEMEKIEFLTIRDLEISNLSERNQPIMTTFDFDYAGGIDVIGNQVFIEPLAFLGLEENPFNENAQERLYPIDIDFPYQQKFIVNVEIPDDYELVSTPEPFNYSLPESLGSLTYSAEAKEKNLQLNLQLQINKQIISADYYGAIQQLYVHLREFSASKIVLNKR